MRVAPHRPRYVPATEQPALRSCRFRAEHFDAIIRVRRFA